MMLDGDEDLVGTPPKSAHERLAEMTAREKLGRTRTSGSPLVEDIYAGVTVSWLSQVFDMDPKTVKAKLADCPPLHKRKAGYIYELKIACRYLVPPALSGAQFLKALKSADLPAHMQQSYWDAALKRQKWEENARHLYRAEDVRDVFASTFQTIKSSMQLFPDTIERNMEVTDAQRSALLALCDDLQNEIYKTLVEQTGSSAHMPQISELGKMTGDDDDLMGAPVGGPEDDPDEDEGGAAATMEEAMSLV